MPFLTATNGPDSGRMIALTLSKYVLGRHPSCHIVMKDDSVSRQHAQILKEGEDFMLEDLKSRNGTSLNSREIFGRQILRAGDIVTICDFDFLFTEGVVSPKDPTKETAPDKIEPQITKDDSIKSGPIDGVVIEDLGESSSSIMSKIVVDSGSGHLHDSKIPSENKLQILIEITQALSTSLKVEQVLPKVLEKLFEIFVQAERGFIVLLEKGKPIPKWYTSRDSKAPHPLRLSNTIISRVLDTQEAIISKSAALDHRFDSSQSMASFPIQSVMCAPILDNDGKSIGCIQIDSLKRGVQFEYGDLEVLIAVAMQAGIAIVNARMHEEALEQREMQRDLELANEVQNRILPQERPQVEGYTFYDYYRSAQSIGGDYYDYVELKDGRWAIMVADVVGHGIPAALLMVKFSAEARYAFQVETTPVNVMKRLNTSISELSLDRFITMILAVFDPKTGDITFVNAGHNLPYIRRANGKLESPTPKFSGFPVGVMADSEYPEFKTVLEPHDSVTIYTDGIVECPDANDVQYGPKRFEETIKCCPDNSPMELGNLIVENILQHMGDAKQIDDMCLVCVGRTG